MSTGVSELIISLKEDLAIIEYLLSMKSIITLLVLFGMLLFSCKSDKNEIKKEVEQIEKAPPSDGELSSIYSYYKPDPKNRSEEEENAIIDYATDQEWSVERTPEGVYYMVTKEGEGNPIKWGEKLSVDYKGYRLDGKVFDSSYKRGEPITFKVGNMIDGWNRTLTRLKKGDHATLIIPSRLAYGADGLGKLIGPDEILVFEIEILNK